MKATKEIIETQQSIGVDIFTDGEVMREQYINYHLRHLDGIDFHVLNQKVSRNGACEVQAPTIVSKILPKDNFLLKDMQIAQ